MLLADTMTYFFLVVGLLFAFPGLWLLCRGLWPRMVADVCSDLNLGMVKPFFLGIPVAFLSITGLFVLGGSKHGPVGDICAIAMISLFLFYANVGIAGLVTLLGQRLPSPADDTRPWKGTIRGGIVLELAFLLPLLGQLIIFPAALIIGAGAVTRRLLPKPRRKALTGQSHDSPRENFSATDLNAEGIVGTPG